MPNMISGDMRFHLRRLTVGHPLAKLTTNSAAVCGRALEVSLPTSDFSSATVHGYWNCEMRYLNEIRAKKIREANSDS